MSDLTPVPETTAAATAASWLDGFARSLAAGDIEAVLAQFTDDCYWRDVLAFTWNIKTLEGPAAIRDMLASTLASTGPSAFALSRAAALDDGVVEAWLTFATNLALGEAIVRLKDGKAWTLFTTMRDLKGHEEPIGRRRPLGAVHRADRHRETWTEARARETAAMGSTVQPHCLVIGGGQAGIAMGARLKQLGVPTRDRREEPTRRRFLAQPLPLARAARPGLVRPSALHPVPAPTGRSSRPRTRWATGSRCTSR